MKKNYLPGWGKAVWQNNKPFFLFIAGLLVFLSVLKIVFYQYNHSLIFSDGSTNSRGDILSMVKWSLLNDLLTILLINLPLLLLLCFGSLFTEKISRRIIFPLFVLLNSFMLLLNMTDIFYFRFHFQRANADLLYVLKHPFGQLLHASPVLVITGTIMLLLVIFFVWFLTRYFFRSVATGRKPGFIILLSAICIAALPFYKSNLVKFIHPAHPLVELNSAQLITVQNSFHSFVYSVFRNGQEVNYREYMPAAACDNLFPIRKTVNGQLSKPGRRNIVLFIMESVPYDFFDKKSPYKVAMPFFDSLTEKSSFYSNAFCFAHQSNKGISAILTGLPTLSDIPLYHSSFINMPMTKIGDVLRAENYHSFFCIGDDYDNFGFAKCANWLGFDHYYCKTDISGYGKMPAHSMGLHDEYVLNFMHDQINRTGAPFFAVNYNISTHYPYDLPAGFEKQATAGYTAPMKSMQYYDHSLHQFFNAASHEEWFRNTVFIFCSDHWLLPNDKKVDFNAISGYRIPIIVYDPQSDQKKEITGIRSQFDVLGSMLKFSGYTGNFISYGSTLDGGEDSDRLAFSRANASLYHVSDSSYILGFNSNNDKAEFLYNYRKDPALQQNLINAANEQERKEWLLKRIKAFLQKAAMQYQRMDFK